MPGGARRHRHRHCVRPSPHVQVYFEAAALRNGILQARVEQNQQETGVVDQSFDLLNRLGTNVSVLSTQPSTVEPGADESFELEENTLDENVSAEDGESVQREQRVNDNLTEAPANMPPTSPENGPLGRGSRSIAESLQELKEEQESQIKERLDLSKKEEENQSALRRLREDLAKYEKEQKDLERKRKAMMEVSGVTLRKMARLEALQKKVDEVVQGEGRREELECPVCTEMIPPKQIFQCLSGHPVCSSCRPRLSSCPTCRQPIIGRNYGMEALIKAM